jgi:hypothetical protein
MGTSANINRGRVNALNTHVECSPWSKVQGCGFTLAARWQQEFSMVSLNLFDALAAGIGILVSSVGVVWWTLARIVRHWRKADQKDMECLTRTLGVLPDSLARQLFAIEAAARLLSRRTMDSAEREVLAGVLAACQHPKPLETYGWPMVADLSERLTLSDHWMYIALRRWTKNDTYNASQALFTAARYATGRLKD